MSNPLKKLKRLLAKKDTSSAQATQDRQKHQRTKQPTTSAPSSAPQDSTPKAGTEHLSPISTRIKAWLDDKAWRYQHHTPESDDELYTHHFVMGFKHDHIDWNCAILVHERNQLISLQGVLLEEIDPRYYLTLMTALMELNQSLILGNLSLDINVGALQARIGFDGEFSLLTDRALDCHLQVLGSLMERASLLLDELTVLEPTLHTLDDMIKQRSTTSDETGETEDGYFVASNQRQ